MNSPQRIKGRDIRYPMPRSLELPNNEIHELGSGSASQGDDPRLSVTNLRPQVALAWHTET